MLIRRIVMDMFMRTKHVVINLPERGIVVITGRNGAGKSSIMEAISMAFWGETLRGTSPWRKDEDGEVTVTSNEFSVSRGRVKSKNTLSYVSLDDGEEHKFNTASEGQKELGPQISVFDVWKRTRVFSSQDASHFTMATAGERTRMLESFLGLECFDIGLDRCRKDIRLAERELEGARTKLHDHQMRTESVRSTIASLEASVKLADGLANEALPVSDANELVELETRVRELDAQATEAEKELREKARGNSELAGPVAVLRAKLTRAKSDADKLADGVCPTCGQDVPEERRHAIADEILKLSEEVRGESGRVERMREANAVEITELEWELKALQERMQKCRTAAAVRRDNNRRMEAEATRRQRAVNAREDAARELEVARNKLEVMLGQEPGLKAQTDSRDLGVLYAVETVLGLRGMRSNVLARALKGIEAVANHWIARIAPDEDLRINLKPYTENEKGAVRDAISLEVTGAGGGFGYKASSGGERRKIDVPLLLGMASIANASEGTEQGTVFFDEVFDTLDQQGVTAVAEALTDFSREYPVVVISHSADVVSSLGAAIHLHVDDGNVSIVADWSSTQV